MIGPISDYRSAELRDFKVVSGDLCARLELSDGTIVEVKPTVQSVLYLGHEPATGLPIYHVGIVPAFRVVSAGPGTRAPPPAKPTPPGFG